MDRTRRILIPHWAMPAMVVMLAATAWIGYRTNSDSRLASSDTLIMSRVQASSSDPARPGLLPQAEMAVVAMPLPPLTREAIPRGKLDR